MGNRKISIRHQIVRISQFDLYTVDNEPQSFVNLFDMQKRRGARAALNKVIGQTEMGGEDQSPSKASNCSTDVTSLRSTPAATVTAADS